MANGYDPYQQYVQGSADQSSAPATPAAPTTPPMASGDLPQPMPQSLPQNVPSPQGNVSPTGMPIAQANDPSYQMGSGVSPSGQQQDSTSMGIPTPYQGPAQRGGAVKNLLTRMLYGLGQEGLRATGQPTDYDIQRLQFDQQLKANQQRISQMQAQSEAQYRQALAGSYQAAQQMVDTPLGPMPQQTWQKIGPAFITSQGRVAAVRAKPQNLNEALAGAIQDSIDNGQSPGDSPAVQAFSTGLLGSKFNETQQFISNWLQKNNLPNTPENWVQAHNALMMSKKMGSVTVTTDPVTGLRTVSSRQPVPIEASAAGVPSAAAPSAQPKVPVSNASPVVTPPQATSPTGGAGTASASDLTLINRYKNYPVYDMADQMVEGNTDPSQIPKRGPQFAVVSQLANAISKQRYGQPFDLAQASIDYNYAKQTSTQNTLKYLNSLTGPDNKSGNLQTLVNMSNSPDLARTQWPPINDVQAWARLKSGSGPQAAYAAAITETADQVAKILQGGGTGSGTSDKKLNDAQGLFQKGFNTQQISDVAGTLRGLLANRKSELIGNNRYLQRQFGTPAIGAAGGDGGPQTSKGIFDSAAWAAANPGKDVNAAKAFATSQGYQVK